MMVTTQPYKFLDYYESEDRDIFCGREREIEILLSDVIATRLVVLFARTGTGKTSLIKAGVQPRLEELDYKTFYIRVEKDPIQSTRDVLRREDLLSSEREKEPLAVQLEYIVQQLERPIVVLFDQFEEFFIYAMEEDPGKAREFISSIAQIYRNRESGVHIVFSMREEFFVRMDAFRDEIPSIFHNDSNLRLRPLDRGQARAAIVQPALKFDTKFEEPLVERLLDDLVSMGEDDRIEPALLQIVCDTLWKQKRNGRITLADYVKFIEGDARHQNAVEVIQRQRLGQDINDNLGDRQLALFEKLLPLLRAEPGTKYVRAFDDLIDLVATDAVSLRELIERLKDLHLLRESTREGIVFVEWTSDYLARDTDELLRRVRDISSWRQVKAAIKVGDTAGEEVSTLQTGAPTEKGLLVSDRDQVMDVPDSLIGQLPRVFPFGSTKVEIREGNILNPGEGVDAVVSTDDNYYTMGSGVAGRLREMAGPDYVRAVQAQCPVKVGTVVATDAYQLPDRGLNVQYVLHAAVIDYDSYAQPLDQIVYQVTANSLAKAQELELEHIVLPAFAAGSGGLSMETCARQMCSAIKIYLAQERPIRAIDVMLYLPSESDVKRKARNQRFVREANLILGVPYDPTLDLRQTRDFYGRQGELRYLEDIIIGKMDDKGGKRHAVVLGGPNTGKWAVLDQIYLRAQQKGSPLCKGRRIVKVTFGRMHENTPASFFYQKLLYVLRASEEDEHLKEEISNVYATQNLDCDHFMAFLDQHEERYPELVVLMDYFPELLRMGAIGPELRPDVKDFWRDLDRLQEGVRFVFTARDDKQYRELLNRLQQFTITFHTHIVQVQLGCVTEQEREVWIDGLFRRYLDRPATNAEQAFFEREAGRHPYLISLAGYALIDAIKHDALTNPMHPKSYTERTLAPLFQAARNALAASRQSFFDLLLGSPLDPESRANLRNLALAVVIEEEKKSLLPELVSGDAGDPVARARWQELAQERDPRQDLEQEFLSQLEARGYLVDANSPQSAQFMSQPFATYVAQFFGIGRRRDEGERPQDVVISLLRPEPTTITTLLGSRGARTTVVQKRVSAETISEFMDALRRYLAGLIDRSENEMPSEFESLEQAGSFLLAQFTTPQLRTYLRNAATGSTVSFQIEKELQELPWELVLETAYAGEIPIRIGRAIIGPGHAHNPPVRGGDKIKALLIGDPTDDLPTARREVEELAERLLQDGRFAAPDVLIGAEQCQLLAILRALSSRTYGLVHFAGHTSFDGYRSAWQLDGNQEITTDVLTSSLQMAPPTLAIVTSGESPDMPNAFLEAGTEVYVGTQWAVESQFAHQFVDTFYNTFLTGHHSVGECLRRAKWTLKRQGDRHSWPAFILYGDPHTLPGDLFPAMLSEQQV